MTEPFAIYDEKAVARIVDALQRDGAVLDVVDEIGDGPAARGAFGLLFPARRRRTGERVLIKVNAAPWEAAWLPAIYEVDPDISPAVFSSGQSIDGLRMPWVVIERLAYAPPGLGGPEWYPPLLRAAFRWQEAAARVDLEPVHDIDRELVASWIDDAIELDGTADLRRLRERFDRDWDWVEATCPGQIHHGDVHFFDAGSRTAGVPHTLVLFDPIPRRAPWPYDAANCHTLTNYSGDVPLVRLAADRRRERGLPTPTDEDVDRVSALFCAWLAVMWRALFRDVQPDRSRSAPVHVRRALRYP